MLWGKKKGGAPQPTVIEQRFSPSEPAASVPPELRSTNPYRGLPDTSFWARSVSRLDPNDVDPVVSGAFKIAKNHKVATAGSCFAQHIAKRLSREGFAYLVTEAGPEERGYGVFPARFGNIYTVLQLLQLFDRAYGLFVPAVSAWNTDSGRYVDPFRPQVEPTGFATIAELEQDSRVHLAAVRAMFETSDVFVFTLGLTEAWRSTIDGAVYPLAAGISGGAEHSEACQFVNFSVAEMLADLRMFVSKLRTVNATVHMLFTVSPVPLIATYEPRHVMVSTTASKAALRVVADEISRLPGCSYFPSYEIILGSHNGNRYFEADLRSVRPEGVDNVMRLFFRHYVSNTTADKRLPPLFRPQPPAQVVAAELADLNKVICDEEAITR